MFYCNIQEKTGFYFLALKSKLPLPFNMKTRVLRSQRMKN